MHIPQTSAARRRSYLLSNSPNKRGCVCVCVYVFVCVYVCVFSHAWSADYTLPTKDPKLPLPRPPAQPGQAEENRQRK